MYCCQNRILGEVHDRIEDILALVFENYKSLDESSESGMVDVFKPATGLAAPALEPALKLYILMHDILSSEAQLKLCRYFQVSATKYCMILHSQIKPAIFSLNRSCLPRLQLKRGPECTC